MRTWFAIVLLATAGLQSCSRPDSGWTPGGNIAALPAAGYLVDAFERFPLVAFSEPRHGAGGTTEFLTSLVRHPRFAGTVHDIVVEFGNARYQNVADRYVLAGEPVPRDQLKPIWENTTVATGIWTAPMYEGLLTEIRSLNRSLPPGKRVRVLLGDPPIDWNVVRGPADEDMNDWRDAHFAWVVEQHVMKKGRRALLWIGGAHISRQVIFPNSLIHLLDSRFPGQTMVAVAIDREGVDTQVADRLGGWPSLAALPVRGTWLGGVEFRAVGGRFSTGTIEQNIDVAILWESPPSHPDEGPRVDSQSPFGVELQRRRQLAEATTAFRGGKIRFQAGAATMTPESEPALRTVLAELERDGGLHLLVKAFADAREASGARLSEERAQAVVDWLVARGIGRDRLEPRGCGSARALYVGHTEQERAANRMAELVRLSKGAGCEPPASFDFSDAVDRSAVDSQLGAIPGTTCTSPPALHCPAADCSPDVIMHPGTVTAPKSRRAFFLDYPCDLKPHEPVTFVLSLHGGGMTGNWQRHYFPVVDLKDTYRLVIATPTARKVLWNPDLDDDHVRSIVDFVYRTIGAGRIKAFWIAGHSHGGFTANRLLMTPFFRDKVTGWVSLSGGRLGSKRAYAPRDSSSRHLLAWRDGAPPATTEGACSDGPGVGLGDACTLPDYGMSFVYTSGEFELTAAGLPAHSVWAQRLGCGAQTRAAEVVDRQGGYVWDSRSPETGSAAGGRKPRPGRAQMFVYPDCRDGHVVADVIRLNKGHTEGLEPRVTEEIVKLMLSAK